MGKGSSPSVTNVNNSPPPQVMAAYESLINQAQNVAATPYTPYSGNTVAPLTSQQTAGINNLSSLYGSYQPDLTAAANSFGAATTPLWPSVSPVNSSTINQYLNPETSDVLAATQQQFANLNAQQNQGVIGSAVQQGAFGGDRAAVAQGILAGQQTASEAPVLAGIQQSDYNTALQTAEQQQQAQLGANEANAWLNSQAGFGYGQLGTEATNLGLETAGAQIQGGGILQQQNQAELNVPYENYLAEQAYPFQTTNWLGQLVEGIGSNSGGSSTSSTTQPGPSTGSQVASGVETAAALALMFANRGGRIPLAGYEQFKDIGRARGGGIVRRDVGGIISIDPSDVAGKLPTGVPFYVPPAAHIQNGKGPPTASSPPPSAQPSSSSQMAGLGDIAKALKSRTNANGETNESSLYDEAMTGVGLNPYGGGDGIFGNAGGMGTAGDFGVTSSGAMDPGAMSAAFGDLYKNGGGIIRRDDGGVMPYDAPGYEIEDMENGAPPPSAGAGPPVARAPMAAAPPPATASEAYSSDPGITGTPFKPYEKPGLTGPDGALPLALLSAAGATLDSPGQATGTAIGRGLIAGVSSYAKTRQQQDALAEKSNEKQADIERAAQQLSETARYHAGQLKNDDRERDEQQQRDQQTATYQQGELAARNTQIANEGAYQQGELGLRAQQLEQGRFTPLGPSTDPNNPGYLFYDQKSGNTVTKPIQVGPKNGGAQSVSQWKYNAWLSTHPGDNQGALDYVAGHKAMSDADIRKSAAAMAESEARSSGLAGDEFKSYVDKRVPELFSTIKGPQAQPTATPANPAAPGTASPATAAPAPVIPPRPQNLPAGSMYSPSRQQWRDPSGTIYDATGKLVNGG